MHARHVKQFPILNLTSLVGGGRVIIHQPFGHITHIYKHVGHSGVIELPYVLQKGCKNNVATINGMHNTELRKVVSGSGVCLFGTVRNYTLVTISFFNHYEFF